MRELVPPVPPVPLSVLTGDPALGLEQLTRPGSGDVCVHAVHTSEMADPRPYLLGGELLLTSGLHCPEVGSGPAAGHWRRYAERAAEAGAAALGFGIAPVHEEVPPALVDACARAGLPLLAVPRETPFTAVARAVARAVAERRHQELRRLGEAQQTLSAAAAGPRPVAAVLRALAHHLDAWTVLLTGDGGVLAEAGTAPSAEVRRDLVSLAGRPSAQPPPLAGSDGTRLGVHRLGGRSDLVLGVCAPRRESAEGAVVGMASVLLSLLTGARAAAADARRSAALVRLMLGAPPCEAASLLTGPAGERAGRGEAPGNAAVGGGQGERPEGRWTVVHGRRRAAGARGRAVEGDAGGGVAGEADAAALSALAAGLGTALLDVVGDRLRALVPGDGPVKALPGWTLGAGPPVPAGELPRGEAEAARALRRALARRREVVRVPDPESGTGVAGLVPPAERRAHARTVLAPLTAVPAVEETLRAWLAEHGSWDRAAAVAGVHRNTVRQRIARAGELLGRDLGDPDVRMELWFALRWR